MHPRLTLVQLRAFVAAADCGSFGAAALSLNLSQSSVSESVRALEALYGQPLLRRSAGGVALTAAGERALPHARRALLAAEDFTLSLDTQVALKGPLVIATIRSLGVHLLPPVLALLHDQHPHLEVQVLDDATGEETWRDFQAGGVDVGLLELVPEIPFLTQPVLEDRYAVVLPASDARPAVTWADFHARTVLLAPHGHLMNARVHAHIRAHAGEGARRVEIAEDDVMLSMVEHGLGWAVLPHLAQLPLRPTLRTLPLPTPLHRTLGLVIRPGRASLPHIQAFLEALRAYQASAPFGVLRDRLGGGVSVSP